MGQDVESGYPDEVCRPVLFVEPGGMSGDGADDSCPRLSPPIFWMLLELVSAPYLPIYPPNFTLPYPCSLLNLAIAKLLVRCVLPSCLSGLFSCPLQSDEAICEIGQGQWT